MIEYIIYFCAGYLGGWLVGSVAEIGGWEELKEDIYRKLEIKHKEAIQEKGEVILEVVAKEEDEFKSGQGQIKKQESKELRVKEWAGWYHATAHNSKLYTSGTHMDAEEDSETLITKQKSDVIDLLPDGDEIHVDLRIDDEELKSELLAQQI